MKSKNEPILIGVFQDAGKAQEAVRALRKAGYDDAHIGVVSRHNEGGDKDSKVATGAAVGAGTVGGVAALWSLGISFGVLPVIGPILAAGPLAAALISGAGGAAAGGLVGAFAGYGLSDEDARYYEGELNAGRTLVTLHSEHRAAEAWRILEGYGATRRGAQPAHA